MERRSVESVVRALNTEDVRYLIAGGLAVVAHGYVRLTADIDFLLDADRENLRRATSAFEGLGYRPRAPVAFAEFADPDSRARWAKEKGLVVFSLFSPAHAATEVDLFLECPLDFAQAWGRAARLEIAPGVWGTFVGFDDLLFLKKKAGRPVDLADVENLLAVREATGRADDAAAGGAD